MTFFHCSDIHLGKTYVDSPGAAERYQDFFRVLSQIVSRAVEDRVDAVVIAGDLFHQAQVMPRTFARTVETLEPLKQAGIPAIAIEGNHDWIHRRESISWMEALSAMGYLHLLRPRRDADGGYHFPDWDEKRRRGGHLEINGVHFYGLGYIGAHAGGHVPRIVEAVKQAGTTRNVLLFHVGVKQYCGTDTGTMTQDEALPLGQAFQYVALGHGHKPYVIPAENPFAFNPGSPECVNFGEEKYGQKGFNRVVWPAGGTPHVQLIPTSPRPMFDERVSLEGCQNASQAEERVQAHFTQLAQRRTSEDGRKPMVRVKLTGRVHFRPVEITRQRVTQLVTPVMDALHVEYYNALSFVSSSGPVEREQWSLAEIERSVVKALFAAQTEYQARSEQYTDLAIRVKDQLLEGSSDVTDLLDLIHQTIHDL